MTFPSVYLAPAGGSCRRFNWAAAPGHSPSASPSIRCPCVESHLSTSDHLYLTQELIRVTVGPSPRTRIFRRRSTETRRRSASSRSVKKVSSLIYTLPIYDSHAAIDRLQVHSLIAVSECGGEVVLGASDGDAVVCS